MDEDVEMDDMNKDESRRRLLDSPEVAVVRPNKEKQRGPDPKVREERQQRVPLEDEEPIEPVDAETTKRSLHCADTSPFERYSSSSDDSVVEADCSTRIPALEAAQESALGRHSHSSDEVINVPDGLLIGIESVPDSFLDYVSEPDSLKSSLQETAIDRQIRDYIEDDQVFAKLQEPAIDRQIRDYIEDEQIIETRVLKPEMERVVAMERVLEETIIPVETDGNVNRQKDLKEDDDRLSLQDRIDLEKKMDEILEAGDLDDISEWVTPQQLAKCATNCLEKSLQVSHKLKSLADAKGPDADDLSALGTSVEDFAVQMLEPLKSDDLKRAIFEGKDFDRVSDKAVKYRQKKFVSHPVVYNLLTRQRWTGYFCHHRYSKNWFKWFLLNFWTFFDVVLFPLVHGFLGIIHLIIEFTKKRQELRIVFLFNASSKFARVQFRAMKNTAGYIMHKRKSDRLQCATITRDSNRPIVMEFNSSEDAIREMPDSKDVTHPTREVSKNKDVKDDLGFLDCLKEAKNLFKETGESKKVLVVMTDDKVGAPSNKFLRAVRSLKQQNVKVISVGFGIHPDIKELETMATSDENVFLIFNDDSEANEAKKDNILECIKGKDIFDRYVQYFTTPYFIFFRDTLSYLALLGLHFAMCLQPSTVHFTPVEWIILVFFLGRLLMEISQLIMEKNSDWTENNDLLQQNHETKEKTKEEEEKEEEEVDEEKEEKQNTKNKKMRKLKKLWRIMSSYFDDWWNILDVVTLIVFLVLVGLRIFIWSQHSSVSKNRLLAVAEYLYGLNAMFLTLRVFGHIMESKKSTGSIQIALFQIISAVIAIFGQFLAATVAFSLAITKIYVAEVSYNSGTNGTSSGLCESQNGLNCWWSSARYLTWSLLGIAELSPLQSSDDTSDVLAKILYGLFLIMSVVMLMNMMIALLSNTYQHVEDNAFYEWSYKKATTIRTYNKYHPVPVPFNIISLSFILLRHIYRMINCTKCKKNKPRHKALPPITATPEAHIEMSKMERKKTRKDKKPLFDLLVEDLQAEYFAVYGYAFPMADDNKMDRVLKETEGCHELIGHIAQRAFRYDQGERKLLEAHGYPDWDTKGIDVVGQRLIHVPCQCTTCAFSGEVKHHGARYLNPLSKDYPEFEVLIQESGERRFVAIGIVTKSYELHKFPGWDGNTAGYHIDDGRIFDSAHSKLGKDGDDAMAYRGDLIGCKILYNKQRDGELPVSFTLNGRVVGEAKLNYDPEFSSVEFYPFVGIGCKGISLLFRMCPKVTLPRADTDPVFQMLRDISEQLRVMNERQTVLERNLEHLSRSLAVEG